MKKNYALHRARFVVLLVFIVLLASCKRAEQPGKEEALNHSNTDTSTGPAVATANDKQAVSTYVPPELHEVIDYVGQENNFRDPSYAFEPFAKLSALVTNFISHKDSLRQSTGAFEKQERVVHAAIMNYKRDVESGKYHGDNGGSLLDLPRALGSKDSSFAFLPEARPSFFRNSDFFFLGGAPFVQQHIVYDTVTHQEKFFYGADGKPELYLKVTDTENKYHLLKSIMRVKRPRVKVDFGGAVNVYDGPPDDVKGIGSVIHNFVDELPVFFLMENGIVPGLLKYYQVPFTDQYACYSDYPYLIFSCRTNIDPSQIVGVYIPYDDQVPNTCAVSRPNKWNWSADLNNDQIPDIACVIGTYEGVESGVLEMLWFVNFNGTWKIIDYGAVPSCT
jgi:hypothetical protein